MAKSKKSSKSNSKKVDQEILVIIYALLCITLSIIGILRLGLVGEMLTRFMTYLVGYLANVVYLGIIAVGVMMLFKKTINGVKTRTVIGIGCFLLAWMIWIASPEDKSIVGMQVLDAYVSNTRAILTDTLIVSVGNGGLIGAALYALMTAFFGYYGTGIVLIVMVLFGLVMLSSNAYMKKLFAQIRNFFAVIKKSLTQRQKKKAERKAKQKIIEYDDSHLDYDDVQTQFDFKMMDVDDEKAETEDVLETIVPVNQVSEKEAEAKSAEPQENNENKEESKSQFLVDYSRYKLPALSLLNAVGRNANSKSNRIAAAEGGEKLIQILEQFGVKATLVETHIGPSVTKFEIKPEPGVRVNKISNLQNDIKMALAAKDIRIEAPIPSKSTVGIEIPNIDKTTVSIRELLRSVPEKYADSKLLFALGKDLLGQPVYGELNKMPHLLIAGATGSGKSACVNSIIISLLMRSKPDEVKLLLVDPKKVEFTAYQQIPHLIAPIINDGEEASRALKVIVNEMDQRYDKFSAVGVRNISGYNEYVAKHPEENRTKMPWIVVIIDELADLMLVAAKDVESSIQRITQLARAAGIHLIVATQRPSVDVITGLIKSNIPSRIAFAVSSAVDSRTILDQQGAEKLLGMGDMLYIPAGETAPTRVQGVYVSDDEINRVTEFASSQGHPMYDDAFIRLQIVDSGGPAAVGSEEDPLYSEAKQFVIETQRASTSLLQRKYSIGYQRAARLIDMLEENGIVGPSRGSKPREVLFKKSEE